MPPGVQVTPDGSTTAQRTPNTNGYSAVFTVKNTKTTTATFALTRESSANITTTGQSHTSVTLAPNASINVTVYYNVGAAGSGWVRLWAEGSGAFDSGTWNVPVGPSAEVTPDGATAASRLANTSGHSESFTIKNNGTVTTSFTLSCAGSSNITCSGVNPGSVNLAGGAQTTASAGYNVGATGTGSLSLTATGGVGSDAGSYNIPVISYGVAVTPDSGEAVARRANSINFGESFTVQNTGTQSDVFTFTCAGSPNVTCARDGFGNYQINPTSLSLAGGGQGTVVVSYETGESGPGRLSLEARGNFSSNIGWFEIPVTSAKVGITPKNKWTAGAFAGTSHTAYFKVTNTDVNSATYTLTCSPSTGVTCTGQSNPSILVLAGQTLQEWVSYQIASGASGNASVQLIAEGPQALGIGTLNFTVWPNVAYAAAVTPASGTDPQRGSFLSGHTTTFLVRNVGTSGDSYTFTCEASASVACAGVNPSSKVLASLDTVTVSVTYNTGATGSVYVGLRAASANSNVLGQRSFTVVASAGYAVAAIPDAKDIGVLPNSGASYPFTIRNPGTVQNTYNVAASCTGSAIASGCTPSASSVTIAAGASNVVNVSYTSGGSSTTGRIQLTATQANDAGVKDSGWVNVATGSSQAPTVAVASINPGVSVERDLCLTVALAGGGASECGDLRLAHALPVVRTMGRARGPTLMYSSAHAHPYPLVAAEVTLPAGGANPDSVEAVLRLNGIEKRRARWAGSDLSPGRANRILIGYDASSEPTGVYSYTVDVANIYGGSALSALTASGQFVLVNRSQTAFGAGWWLAGLERIYLDSLLWVGGDGSARVYRPTGISDVWAAAALDRPDTLKKVGSEYVRLLPAKREVWFDNLGRHVRTISRLKHDTTFFYYTGASTQLDSAKVPPVNQGLKFGFSYNGSGVLTSVSAPGPSGAARTTTLTLSGRQVAAITDPDTTTVSFGYDAGFADRIITRTDRENALARYFFDAASKVVRDSLDPGSSQEVIVQRLRALESVGFIGGAAVDTSAASALIDGPRTDVGDSTQAWLDRFGSPRRIRNALGHETVLARENASYPALVTRMLGPNGRVTRATYDGRGRILTSTDSGTVVNGQVAITRHGWDDAWDAVTVVVPPEGDSTVIGIEASTGHRLWQQDASGSASRVDFTYHANGLVATIREPGETAVASLNYDARGNLRETISPLGFRDSIYVDNVGRDTLALTPIDSAQTAFQKKRTWYDLADQVKKTETSGPAPNYTLTYVPRDTTSITADTATVENTYDKEGRLAGVLSYARPSVTGDLADVRTYDRAGRLLTQKFGSGPRTVSYDPAGNPISQTYAGATAPVVTSYDALNRAIRRVVPRVVYGRTDCQGHAPGPIGGGSGTCLMRFPFHPNLTGDSLEIPADTSVFAYDLAGNMVQADNRYAQVRRTYLVNGLLESDTLRLRNLLSPAFGHVYGQRYRYDRNGRRTWAKLPLPAAGADSLTYAYSVANGALAELRQSSGRWLELKYTLAGRLDSLKVYPSAGGSAGVLESRVYDDDGRLSRRERRTGAGGFLQLDMVSYDAQGRVRQATTQSAAQDHLHKRTTATYGGLGAIVASEVMELNTTNWEAEEFRNDALGNVWYDRWRSRDDQSKTPRRTAFNGRGLLTRRTRDVPPTCGGAPYSDSLYQAADGGGNVLRAGEFYNPCQQGASWTQGATNSYYTADNKLAFVQRYDPAGRGTWEEYWMDALGRRVLIRARRETGLCGEPSECASLVQRAAWDGDQILIEQRTSGLDGLDGGPPHYGTVGYAHALGIDNPVALLDGRVIHYNWRGLAEASSWSDGTPADCQLATGSCTRVAWPAGQGVYFRRGVPEPAFPVPTWIGSLPSNGASTTGQLYRRNRYYDPASGRFTQEDPIGLAGGLNLYGYANGDPVNFSDPFGLTACPPQCADFSNVVAGSSSTAPRGLNAFGRAFVSAMQSNVDMLRPGTAENNAFLQVFVYAGQARSGGRGIGLRPDPRASGPHTTFRVGQEGKVKSYETWEPQTNPRNPAPWQSTGRFDGSGEAHYNRVTKQDVPTPHVHDPRTPGGIRPATPPEIPK